MSELFKATDKTLILGRSGTGKTYLSRVIQKIYPRVWVWDPTKEYSNEEFYVKTWNDFEKVFTRIMAHKPQKYRIIIQLERNLENKPEMIDQILHHIYDLGNCNLVLEEAHMLATTKKMGKNLEDCFLTGRHQNMSMICTSQRVSLLHKTIGSQCAHVFCGHTFEMNDLEYLKKTFRFDPEKIMSLAPQYFYYFRPGHETLMVHNSLKK